MKENNTMKKEQIKIGTEVIVNGACVIIDQVVENNPHRPFWGTTEDGEEIGFSFEHVMAIVPE